MSALGTMLQVHAFALKQREGEGNNLEELKKVISRIGMVQAFEEKVWDYGEIGTVSVIPLIESFAAMDHWPQHGGKYLIVCSCRPFKPGDVESLCAELGYQVTMDLGGKVAI